ncbi:MAG: hypothetical protein LBR68_05595, partial [Lachnoclostridium sp.]|nr:hypothetical protein [Lachnoclostridium sp.]
MDNLRKREKNNSTFFLQILFTALAFAAMSLLSYIFMGTIVRENLARNADSVLDFTENQVSLEIGNAKNSLINHANTIHNMILQGDRVELIEEYIDNVSNAIVTGGSAISSSGLYGYFETLTEEPIILHGKNWEEGEDYNPEAQEWYQLAVSAHGETIETIPVINDKNERIFTMALCIYDEDGRRLGTICRDVQIDNIAKEIVNTAMKQGGYGILINQELLVLAHPNKDFVGKDLSNPSIPISIYADDLMNNKVVSEESVKSYKGEPAVTFIRKLSNGWHIAMVAPKAQYYENMTNMAAILIILGISLAFVLIIILVRIEASKNKSDFESKQKSVFLANMSHEIRTPIN